MSNLSKTQVDRLGERLKKNGANALDLKTLDDFRKSFSGVYEQVIKIIRENLKLKPTGRPAKSTTSIIDKLNRESIRLSQLQDISGCRITVGDIREQDSVVALLRAALPPVSVVDRRAKSSYGYRAVHLIVKTDGKLVEIQVRTTLQHKWAELSEKFSDKIDPLLKYGKGPKEIQDYLMKTSILYQNYEEAEADITGTPQIITDESQMIRMADLKNEMNRIKKKMISLTKFRF